MSHIISEMLKKITFIIFNSYNLIFWQILYLIYENFIIEMVWIDKGMRDNVPIQIHFVRKKINIYLIYLVTYKYICNLIK